MNSIGLCKEQIGNGIFLFNTRAFLNKLALMFYNVLSLTKEESIDKYILQDGHLKEIYINHGFSEISFVGKAIDISDTCFCCQPRRLNKNPISNRSSLSDYVNPNSDPYSLLIL